MERAVDLANLGVLHVHRRADRAARDEHAFKDVARAVVELELWMSRLPLSLPTMPELPFAS